MCSTATAYPDHSTGPVLLSSCASGHHDSLGGICSCEEAGRCSTKEAVAKQPVPLATIITDHALNYQEALIVKHLITKNNGQLRLQNLWEARDAMESLIADEERLSRGLNH